MKDKFNDENVGGKGVKGRNVVIGPKGAPNHEILCWRGPVTALQAVVSQSPFSKDVEDGNRRHYPLRSNYQ
jgi:hypothetical protein